MYLLKTKDKYKEIILYLIINIKIINSYINSQNYYFYKLTIFEQIFRLISKNKLMGNKNENEERVLDVREKTRRFIEKEMSRPHGKEIIEIEEKLMELTKEAIELTKRMDHLLMERYEIEKRKEEEEKQKHQQY